MKRSLKKLTLNRETIRRISDAGLAEAAGGNTNSCNTCNTLCFVCPSPSDNTLCFVCPGTVAYSNCDTCKGC